MIFGFGLLAKIVLAWSIVFFNPLPGGRVDADLIHSARFLGASERQIIDQRDHSLRACVDLRVPDALHLLRPHRGGGRRVHRRRIGRLGVIGIVMALRIKQVEARLLRWRPEYQKR
jgi:hypothetical protein